MSCIKAHKAHPIDFNSFPALPLGGAGLFFVSPPDFVKGGAGNDRLAGGPGTDSLTGGTGSDRFRFVTTGQGADNLTDFASRSDKIEVVAANLGNLPLGTLVTGRFKAADASLLNAASVFLYSAATGALSFDSNGNGAGGVTLIARLTGSRDLEARDI